MRRTVPLLLSLLFLVGAQSAGLLHAIGHAAARHDRVPGMAAVAVASAPVAVAPALQPVPAGSHSPDKRCDKCFQFAHFSGHAAPSALGLQLAQTTGAPCAGPRAALIARAAPASRSRGPPTAL